MSFSVIQNSTQQQYNGSLWQRTIPTKKMTYRTPPHCLYCVAFQVPGRLGFLNLSRNDDVNTEFLAKMSHGLQGRSSTCRKFLAGVILSPVSDLTICTQANMRTRRRVDWRPCRHAVCFSSVLLFMALVTHCFLSVPQFEWSHGDVSSG